MRWRVQAIDLRLLAASALVFALPACFRDPDVTKMKCTPDKGCPAGFACVNSGGTFRCAPTSSVGMDGAPSPAADGPLTPTTYDLAHTETAPGRLDAAGTSGEAQRAVDGSVPDALDAPMTEAAPVGTGGSPGAGGAGGGGGTTGSGGATAGTGGVLGGSGGIAGTGGATAGAPGSGGVTVDGGVDVPVATGGVGTGGAGTGGRTGSGGTPGSGGAGTGGTPGTGGAGTGGSPGTGGTPGSGGAGTGGSPGTGGSGTGGSTIPCTLPGNCPPDNTPVPSAGCGTQGVQTLLAGGQAVSGGLGTSYRLTTTSGGVQREYIIDVPANYDNTHPYRLFFAFHGMGATDTSVATGQITNGGAETYAYYGLHRMATTSNDPAVFIAPQGSGSTWTQSDHAFFDDLLALAKGQLCIDTTRVFITGFSFGAMFVYSVSLNHQDVVRAAVAMSPANYNIYMPADTHQPIPWLSTTGMSDSTTPWDSGADKGAKYIALSRAQDNGCTIPASIPTSTAGSRTHLCYEFQGCATGKPVRACTFDGGHQPAPTDGATGDNGLTSWIPTESWSFFTRF